MPGRRSMFYSTEALRRLSAIIVCSAVIAAFSPDLRAQAVEVGTTQMGGVDTSSKGPEAGLWFIAKTTDLPTKFPRIFVTDAQGRYLIPAPPAANYSVWVRGYGLVDSPKMTAK